MIGEAVVAMLNADATVNALVNGAVYALAAPQPAPSTFVVHTTAGGIRWNSLSGPSGLGQPRVQIDCYARTYEAAHQLADAVRGVLDGFRGTVFVGTDSPQRTIRIGGISAPVPYLDFYEDSVDPPLYRVSMDYLITHDE